MQTGQATQEISQQIERIQTATRQAVASIQAITETIGEIDRIAANIASGVEQQSATTQDIARNVQQAAGGTREVSATIVDVKQSATSTGTAAGQVLDAARQLSRQAAALTGEVNRFITDVKAA
jgi:methyl-accepting chemotaxis protein